MKAGEIKKHAAKVFAESSGYLLILDNGDDIDVLNSVFGESRKHGFGGDVIVTSRAASIAEGAFNQAFKFKVNRYTFDPLMIMPWSQEIAFDYVMKQCPKLSNKAKSRESIAKVKNLISRIYSNNLVLHTFIFFFDSNTIPLAELERAFGQVLNRNHGETDAQLSLRAIVTMTLDGEMNKGPTGHATCCLYSAICLG
ncbi:uncharacterized protein BJ171DRAFT_500705 [Polychytrium aggregatum]|uniref:uncharacterized protein n=1 Tax=Polychytrium aggregatum TaxID=110093 RepID=UPI0022FE989B|nr:uncharacterized protein BJ171DRAFT_500705 [Polychytrium aggregatum]KAI9205528.1 hypothetical protein BJ171DRAFT_500705 [Polychytrium aggregatum]